MALVRPEFDNLPEYQAGRAGGPLEAASSGITLLASNESPWPPPKAVISAMDTVLQWLNRYPSMTNDALRQELAGWHGTGVANLVVGCGGVEIGRLAGSVVLAPGKKAVFGVPSFPEYEILTRLCGGAPATVPLTELTYDLDAIAQAIDSDTKLAIICNPNNPTGTGVGYTSMRRFLGAVPSECLVLVDEAYWEYSGGELGDSAITMVDDFPNLVVLRTFSKAFGLAGIRVGYGVASEAVARAMRKVQLPFSVNLVAEAAAIAAIRGSAQMEQRAAQVRSERERVRTSLLALGLRIPVSHANFIFIEGDNGLTLARACEANQVTVRLSGSLGSRITIGTVDENEQLLAIAAHAMTKPPANSVSK